MNSQDVYFDYLRGRTWTGLLYRRHWVYPRLCLHLHGRVLDVGCGLGDMLQYRPNTDGIDINPKAVEWCRSRGLRTYLMQPDHLPFADASYDGALLDNVLEHVNVPQPLLAEIRRVVKAKGRVVVGVPGRKGFASDPDHKVFYCETALRRTLTDADFSCLSVFHLPFRSFWLDRRVRKYCIYGVFEPN